MLQYKLGPSNYTNAAGNADARSIAICGYVAGTIRGLQLRTMTSEGPGQPFIHDPIATQAYGEFEYSREDNFTLSFFLCEINWCQALQ